MVISLEFKTIRAWFAKLFAKKETKMSLTATSTTLTVGQTAQLSASFSATFTSSDPSVLTVGVSGFVTAVGEGNAVITALATDESGSSDGLAFVVNAANNAVTAALDTQDAPVDASALAATLASASAALAASAAPATPATQTTSTSVSGLDKLEDLIEKVEAKTLEEVKALITYIRTVA